MTIILRKSRGVLTPMLRPIGASFGNGSPPSAVLAFLLSPLVLLLLGLAILAVWFFAAPAALHAVPLTDSLSLATVPLVSTALTEQRQQFAAKQKDLAEIFTMAKDGSVYDFSRKAVLEKLGATDAADAFLKVKARNVELDDLGTRLQHAELKEIESAIGERDTVRSTPIRGGGLTHPVDDPNATKTFGQMVIESKTFREAYQRDKMRDVPIAIDIDMKTLFQTSAGYAPQSVRSGLLVEAVTRPIQLLDLIPTRPINQAVDKYMEETTRTHAAAEKAEAAAFAESTFVWTEKTNTVQKITDSIPVTDEQIEDAPEVASILDQRLRFGLRQRLDKQVFNGDGTSPNLRGILNVSGIQTQAKSTDPVFDAVFKAMMLVRITGRAFPNLLVFHPTDWQTVRLTRTADGQYIMGNPSEPGPMMLFGVPAALCDAGSAGTAVVGDALNFAYVGERRGVEVQIGYSGTQFVEGKKTLRADLRAVFTVTRPAAFCTVTGL